MRNLFFVSLIMGSIFVSNLVCAEIIWQEDFDGYPQEWSLNDDNDGRYNCPADLYGGDWPYCAGDMQGDYGRPDIEITSAADRGGGGRGFRLHIWRDSGGTCCENGITDSSLWPGQTNFYLRWYMRLNYNSQNSYAKIFRLKDSSNTQRFIFDWYNSAYHSNGKTVLTLFSAADGFSSYNDNENWSLEDDYTPNTWVCFEAYIDQTNNQWTMWVDGVQQGSPVSIPNTNYTITGTMVGANQVGQGSVDHVIDYDDIAVSTTYIGPDGTGGNSTPTPPSQLRILTD